MRGQCSLTLTALDQYESPRPDRHAFALPPHKKIARASEEARAKPSPYEERRRGHRDPCMARIVIGFAPALAAPASEDVDTVGRTVTKPPAL
jgi:hypothetical protein